MGIVEAVRSGLTQYANFSGRARRSEYWFFYLASVLAALAVLIVFGILGGVIGAVAGSGARTAIALIGYLVITVLYLGLLVPSLALNWRRLHDVGRSGVWILISLVPFGGIVLLVFHCMDSVPGPNQYGPNPKGIVGGGYGGGFGGGPTPYGPPGQF